MTFSPVLLVRAGLFVVLGRAEIGAGRFRGTGGHHRCQTEHPTEEAAMRPGTYLDKDDKPVTVRRTLTGGYIVTHADGTVTAIGGN